MVVFIRCAYGHLDIDQLGLLANPGYDVVSCCILTKVWLFPFIIAGSPFQNHNYYNFISIGIYCKFGLLVADG